MATFVLAAFNVSAATLYVSLESPNPTPPYTNWTTAARVIQDAVDAARNGDTVLVTNGIYKVGERDTSILNTNTEPPQSESVGLSRVVVTNSIRLESVNGPSLTTIEGHKLLDEYGGVTNGVRCVLLANNSILSGFTLTKGSTVPMGTGGGVHCESAGTLVTNCVIVGNSAWRGGGASGGTLFNCTLTANLAEGFETSGGGANQSTLYNCTLTGNSALNGRGGGADMSILYNCIVAENSAGSGGGVSYSSLFNCVITGNSASWGGGGALWCKTLYNCIVYYNTATTWPNYGQDEWSGPISYSCTSPLPTNGVGNITGPPLFMDMAAGDFRLWEGSPCIDAGANLVGLPIVPSYNWDTGETLMLPYTHAPTDALGNTRFIDGNGNGIAAWDIGAYEFNSFKPPRFTAPPQRTAEGWRLNIIGEPNRLIMVQRSRNLSDWEEWYGWLLLPADGVVQIADFETNQMMFYRAVVP